MATPVKMARVSKVASSAEVVEWLKSPGEAVRQGEPLLRVLSEKATVDLDAPASGILLAQSVLAGREVPVGTLLGWIGEPGEQPPAPDTATSPQEPAKGRKPGVARSPSPPARAAGPRAVPAARRLARERGLALEGIPPREPGGIITVSDVERASQRTARVGEGPAQGDVGQPPGLAPGEHAEPLGGIQRIMLERMTANQREIAQATTVAEVDVTDIMGLRSTVPATLTAWVILAVARALREYPILNASLRGSQLVYHAGADIGVSVETDAGLLVPVIRDAQNRTLAQVNAMLEELVATARAGQLTPEDMVDPTFTVTNSGVLGSVLYTPMIVPPQSAILGMGRAAKTPVVREDQVVVRTLMYLCLSYDHRFIAGGTAVRCLQRIRAYLENPLTLVWDAAGE